MEFNYRTSDLGKLPSQFSSYGDLEDTHRSLNQSTFRGTDFSKVLILDDVYYTESILFDLFYNPWKNSQQDSNDDYEPNSMKDTARSRIWVSNESLSVSLWSPSYEEENNQHDTSELNCLLSTTEKQLEPDNKSEFDSSCSSTTSLPSNNP